MLFDVVNNFDNHFSTTWACSRIRRTTLNPLIESSSVEGMFTRESSDVGLSGAIFPRAQTSSGDSTKVTRTPFLVPPTPFHLL